MGESFAWSEMQNDAGIGAITGLPRLVEIAQSLKPPPEDQEDLV